ncbi:ABC transporter ATP-binding protein [Aureibacter tunicatorum]|uniref:ABC transport system ATP-binding protein n=1 Tax=Aureibacter tunicatorum TaxID=866807 RepID=A0AAE3XJY3_9BACT|nr:ABC transporter ATP-binding protein [Aureibacter tunicatorum]MDR6237875.1 putative ABC transport system ATP-binding protein [Aureibacter tunicatorum]BDD02910.1 ABC transporter ATP-binding protein [Aureibacter tunicatorum]
MNNIIKLEKVNQVFRTEEVETRALNEIGLEVKEGEFLAIMGPSGCGKSTLLNIIGLLDTPESGKYVFDGNDTQYLKEKGKTELRKGNIGFVFQDFNLIDELTVFENVEMPLIYLGISSSERKAKVMKTLERMKISHRRGHFPAQLSGGQQQRVAIARAVVADPKLLLADEPTGNLDSKNGQQVMELLTELNKQGTTVVMVTHSQRDADYAHRVIHLNDGEVSQEMVQRTIGSLLM